MTSGEESSLNLVAYLVAIGPSGVHGLEPYLAAGLSQLFVLMVAFMR